ncbi:MAG: YbhN family protein [Candidatus Saccharimonadales bacterium]
MKPTSKRRTKPWRLAINLIIIVVVVFFIITQAGRFKASWQVLSSVSDWQVSLGLIATGLTYVIAASIYRLLAFKRLPFGLTFLVEVSTAFANRLLPAGLGGLGLNGVYLHKRGHSLAEATAVVSINNLIGIAGHLLLLLALVVISPSVFSWPGISIGSSDIMIVTGLVIILVVIISVWRAARRRVASFGQNLGRSLVRYLKNPQKLLLALMLAMLLTLLYVFTLWISAHAVGLSIAPVDIFVIFTIGVLVGTVTPTPGGLVGVEAGLYAGFASHQAAAAPALAAVLLFRVITYWLPLAPGFIALLLVRQKHIV